MVVVPSPITGTIGSRIRVVLGENGNEWLLLLNHDNGSTTWQVKDWSSIPNAVAKQINNCTNKGRNVTDVDFNSNGAWFVRGEKSDGTGGYCWWGGLSTSATSAVDEINKDNVLRMSLGTSEYNDMDTYAIIEGRNGYSSSANLDNAFEDRLKRINNRRKTINFVRLFHNGQYFISDSEGTEWSLCGDHFAKELKKNKKKEDAALAVDGSWVVIFDNTFEVSTGVDKKLTKALSKFYSVQRKYIEDRRQEIREANAANERERVARERAAQEAREAAEREAREARAAAEREAREAAERQERERIRREAERAEGEAAAAAQLNAANRISSLEATLEKRLIEEAQDIKDSETKLQNRKRSFREAMQSMPAETQARITLDDTNTSGNDSNTCVICHDDTSVMAVSPCGHVCLCNSCADICMSGQNGRPSCPLCRGDMQSVLRVYWGSN